MRSTDTGPASQKFRRDTWLMTGAGFVVASCLAVSAFGAMREKNGRNDERTDKTKLFLTVSAPAVLPKKTELATFAAGCFWGVEDHFRKMPGVLATAVGYTGGHKDEPTYKEVCNEDTGHAEAVQLEFDPAVVSYAKLVDEFLWIHDPTTKDRQGPDVGSQYRSAIFFHDSAQQAAAKKAIKALQASGELDDPIVTEVTRAPRFWFAEGYHQQWVEKGGPGACHPRRPKK